MQNQMSPFFEMELQKQAWTGVCVFLYPPQRPLSWSWHFRKRTPEVFPEGFKERLWVKTGPRKSVEKKSASVHCLRSKMTSLGGKKELSAQSSWGYELCSHCSIPIVRSEFQTSSPVGWDFKLVIKLQNTTDYFHSC